MPRPCFASHQQYAKVGTYIKTCNSNYVVTLGYDVFSSLSGPRSKCTLHWTLKLHYYHTCPMPSSHVNEITMQIYLCARFASFSVTYDMFIVT